MQGMKVGDTVTCTPTRVSQDISEVKVEIWGADIEIGIPLGEIFANFTPRDCLFYGGAVLRHQPYDIVRTGRPFVAKVIKIAPLKLSRTQRIADLWHDLEELSKNAGYVSALLLGQNKTSYFLSIEGNVFFRSDKTALEDYVHSTLTTAPLLHKYAPAEGDTLLARVVSVSPATNDVALDFLSPLQDLDSLTSSKLPFSRELSPDRVSRASKRAVTNVPDDRVPTPKWLTIDHSTDLDARRKSTNILVVEDDPRFGGHLAQLLNQIGYQAEYIETAENALKTLEAAQQSPTLLVDAIMSPMDGITLIAEVTRRYGPHVKCVLMSALRWEDPLDILGRIPLGEAVRNHGLSCPFWNKCSDDLENALAELDRIVLNDGLPTVNPRTTPSRPSVPSTTTDSSTKEPLEYLDELATILTTAKLRAGAQWGAIFAMDRTEWKVDVLAGEDFLKEQIHRMGAQSYLPNSPVRDLSYQDCPVLLHEDVNQLVPRFRNLLRFFGPKSFDDFADVPFFRSIAAIRLDIKTSIRYSLFLFHPHPMRFLRNTTIPVLEQAAKEAELVILRRLHTLRSIADQPFYLEGLGRTGLRHDARSLLTDIQMAADLAISAMKKSDLATVTNRLEDILLVAKDAYQRITESLDAFTRDPVDKEIDLRLIIKRAINIAAGVAAHSHRPSSRSFGTKPPTIYEQYPDNEPITIRGDPSLLQRILENLLVNAVEHGMAFVRHHISILIEVKRLDASLYPLVILVHDNGPGIHGVDRLQIFEPLFSTKNNGYGMGLAVARQIANDCGASLAIFQSAILAGTTFWVRLPKQMTPQFGKKLL